MYVRAEKAKTVGDKAVRQTDMLGTGHVILPSVKLTADNSPNTGLFSHLPS